MLQQQLSQRQAEGEQLGQAAAAALARVDPAMIAEVENARAVAVAARAEAAALVERVKVGEWSLRLLDLFYKVGCRDSWSCSHPSLSNFH